MLARRVEKKQGRPCKTATFLHGEIQHTENGSLGAGGPHAGEAHSPEIPSGLFRAAFFFEGLAIFNYTFLRNTPKLEKRFTDNFWVLY